MEYGVDLPGGQKSQLICHWVYLFHDHEGSISLRG